MKVFDYWLSANPTLRKAVNEPLPRDFLYYDKDGFELCIAEQSYYIANDIQLDPCLNHLCCQQPWLSVEGAFTDHALILHRFDYSEEARKQLTLMHSTIPQAGWLLQTKQKWGYDLALDSVTDYGHMFEVIHIEFDTYDFVQFKEALEKVQEQIARMDWREASNQIWRNRDRWGHLKGFVQNHWKANYLFGWDKAEYTEKAI
jgi:hypothetical protein